MPAVVRTATASSVIFEAWFKTCQFQVTPEIDKALMVKGFLVLGVTLIEPRHAGFPDNTELSIDANGTPHLKQLNAASPPAGLAEFEQEIRARMPERHL